MKIVNFIGNININSVLLWQKEILTMMESQQSDKIIVQISSGGGELSSAIMFYHWLNSINEIDLEIHAIEGLSSAANLFLLTKHKTCVYPHISFMFHLTESRLNFSQNNKNIVIGVDDDLISYYWSLFEKKTKGKISRDWIEKTNFTFLSAKELLKIGMIDEII